MALMCRAGGIERAVACADAQEAEEALKTALEGREYGVILVLDRYLAAMPPPQVPDVYPVVIGVPGAAGPSGGDDAAARGARRVAGRGLSGVSG